MSDEREKAKVGRPSLLTAETRAKLLEAIREGVSREAACAYAGISYTTLVRWLRQGRQDEEGEFRELLVDVKQAEAELEIQVLEQIRQDLPGNPRAALSLLARRFPRRWGERVNITVERELTNFLNRLEARLPPEIFRLVLDESLAAAEAEEPDGDDEPAAGLAEGKVTQ